MAVRVLTGTDGYQVLYCSSTMRPFGEVHNFGEDFPLEDFVASLPKSPLLYTDSELNSLYYSWLARERGEQNAA